MDFRSGSMIPGLGLPSDIFSRLGIGKPTVQYNLKPIHPDQTPFSFNKFAAELGRHGLAKSNLYYVEIPDPRRSGNVEQLTSMYCCAAEFPSRNIETHPVKIQSYSIETPHGVSYPDVDLEFYVDVNFNVKTFFDYWQNQVLVKNGEVYDIAYRSEYVAPIKIFQLDAETNVVHTVTLEDAYPKVIHPLKLGYQNGNTFHTLRVTFTYKRWLLGSEWYLRNLGTTSTPFSKPSGFMEYVKLVTKQVTASVGNVLGSVNKAISNFSLG